MNTPEIGSKWQVVGRPVQVVDVRKRGRGYQVEFYEENQDPTEDNSIWRLRDFLKAAKPL